MQDKVLAIARKTRAWAMRNRHTLLEYTDEYLSCMCAIVSAQLHKNLETAGIPATLQVQMDNSCGHVFVEAGGHIVDITATQFNEKRAVITGIPLTEAKKQKLYWDSNKEFKHRHELFEFLAQERWAEEQMPKLAS